MESPPQEVLHRLSTQSTTFTNGTTFFTQVIAGGPVSVAQSSSFANSSTFHAAAIAAGAPIVTQTTTFLNSQTFPAHQTDAEGIILLIAAGVAVAALLTTIRLHRGYVAALAEGLRRGAVRLTARDALDATTRRTLAETSALDRRKLLASIERMRQSGTEPTEAPPPESISEETLGDLPPDVREEGFGSAPVSLRLLLSGDEIDTRTEPETISVPEIRVERARD